MKVVGQRLVYKFDKLPYKYVPGVTRSRCHGHRINACIQNQLRQVEVAPSHVSNNCFSSSFSPVSTAAMNRCCFPLKHITSRPIMWCPGPMPHAQQIPYPKTRVIFPSEVDPMVPLPLPFGFNPYSVNLSPENRVFNPSNPYFYRHVNTFI
ncbi:hypothetical protein OS493_037271 [Desmophyllum pertusum]|uniref:Uncharacterized protein n=1 Tax=Desmophyllum pertusum TaxID=174260 RepID=A0A9W9YI03_9CNID|nr:hypothetical protein OS493_037271 [Desmophyllum pertusum]